MLRVFKYDVLITDKPVIMLPKGAKILSVGTQEEPLSSITTWVIRLWALVDPKVIEQEVVRLRVAGTGHPISEDVGEFLGTVMFNHGGLVFHVFRKDKPDA